MGRIIRDAQLQDSSKLSYDTAPLSLDVSAAEGIHLGIYALVDMQSLRGQSADAFHSRSLSELLNFEVDFFDSLADPVCPLHWSVDNQNYHDDDAEGRLTELICCHQLWPKIVETYFACRLVSKQP